jgi:tetratricopeptide (TPR) repeat protein
MNFGINSKRLRALLGRPLFVVLAWVVLCVPARAAVSPEAFDAANKLYDAGKFADAAAAYTQLLQSGRASSAIYFNLGNAFFRAGEIGRAIAAYRNAGQLAPRDPDIRANLQFARNQVQGPTRSPPGWQQALGKLNLNEWTWLASAAVWLCLLILTLFQIRPMLKPLLRNYLVAMAVVTLCLCGCLGLVFQQTRFSPSAIVVARDAAVHQGPLDESKVAFTAHDGAELKVIDQKDNWLEVRTDPQHFGWVNGEQVLMLNQNAKAVRSQR